MQFHVPQNIDLEDKIVGPLTLRQFVYLLIGGTIDYILFQQLGPSGQMALFLVVGIPIGLLALALAFIKVQERPFGDFLVALISYSMRPQKRIWHRESLETKGVVQANKKKITQAAIIKREFNRQEVNDLAKVLDGGGGTATKVADIYPRQQEKT